MEKEERKRDKKVKQKELKILSIVKFLFRKC